MAKHLEVLETGDCIARVSVIYRVISTFSSHWPGSCTLKFLRSGQSGRKVLGLCQVAGERIQETEDSILWDISFIPCVKVMGLLLFPIKSPSLRALESGGYNTMNCGSF